jgi:cysteine desulfurase / selenocysteine lyase
MARVRCSPHMGGGVNAAPGRDTIEPTRFQRAPARFEAGAANIAGAIGLGTALDYVTRLGPALIAQRFC